MKRIKYLLILICSCLFLAACDNSLARVDRAVGLIQEDTTGIINDLATYVNDYTANLALESQSFKSIANPESNYQSFFDVLKNVNTLSTTNLMNLDKVLPHFEKLNANLVNLKVDLVKLKEQKK